MQSPVKITTWPNSAILEYGLIERGSVGVNIPTFVGNSERNAVTSIVGGTDPIIQIPGVVSNFANLEAKIQIRGMWYVPGSGLLAGTLMNLELPILAINNVSPSSLLIKQNGMPIQAMLSDNCALNLQPEPGTLDFTSFTVKYAIPASVGLWSIGADLTVTTTIMQVFIKLILIASNGTN